MMNKQALVLKYLHLYIHIYTVYNLVVLILSFKQQWQLGHRAGGPPRTAKNQVHPWKPGGQGKG